MLSNDIVKKIINAESPTQSYDRFLSSVDHRPNYVSRGIPQNKHPQDNVQVYRLQPEGSHPGTYVGEWFFGHNGVTDQGDSYYTAKAAGTTFNLNTPDANHAGSVARMQYANPASQITTGFKAATWATISASAIAGSKKAFDTGYPTPNDPDTNDPDRAINVVAYRATHGLSDWNDTQGSGGGSSVTVKNVALHDITGTATSTDKLLSLGTITPFNKDGSTIIIGYVSHAFLGS